MMTWVVRQMTYLAGDISGSRLPMLIICFADNTFKVPMRLEKNA